MCGGHFGHGKNSSQQDLYVVEKLKEPLRGGVAIKALNLLKAVNMLRSEGHHYKEEFIELGKLEYVYHICLDVEGSALLHCCL